MDRWTLKADRIERQKAKAKTEKLKKDYERMRAFATYLATPGALVRHSSGKSVAIIHNTDIARLNEKKIRISQTMPGNCTALTLYR